MTSLQGRTVLVTGAAAGIGRRLVHLSVERGARVVAWDLDAAGLDALVASLPDGAVVADVVDVSSNAAVTAGARRVLASTGPVDVLVNNAGVVSGAPLLELTPEQIERTFRVNVLALFWTTRAFLPGMIANNSGHVVTLASAAGLLGVDRQTDYAASKHAAVGFDGSLRQELRKRAPGVRTTVVCPFFVDTGMFDGAKTRVPWLLPILREDEVSEAIVKAVERNRRRLFLPPVVQTLYLGHMLPTGAFDRLMAVLGVNASMDDFVGRERAR